MSNESIPTPTPYPTYATYIEKITIQEIYRTGRDSDASIQNRALKACGDDYEIVDFRQIFEGEIYLGSNFNIHIADCNFTADQPRYILKKKEPVKIILRWVASFPPESWVEIPAERYYTLVGLAGSGFCKSNVIYYSSIKLQFLNGKYTTVEVYVQE